VLRVHIISRIQKEEVRIIEKHREYKTFTFVVNIGTHENKEGKQR
jgi:hypothetical protein